MLTLKKAIRDRLGESITVTHNGNPVTVPIGYEGHDDETPLPAAFVGVEFGNSRPANIGDTVTFNKTTTDIIIQTLDSDDIDGPLLLAQIHQEMLTLLRTSPLGDALHTHVNHHRDFPARKQGGVYFYTRILNVTGFNFRTH